MKYGAIYHEYTTNIGDDIQTLAGMQFLPQVDYMIPRENMYDFRTDSNEPVAVIMNGWFMWEKYNWPPAKCIIPKFVSFHYSIHSVDVRKGAPPADDLFLSGVASEYLNSKGPIGCRDEFTHNYMQKNNVDSYVSGCLTLALPKMEIREVERLYICLVDVEKPVQEMIKKQLEGSDLEIKVITHKASHYLTEKPSWEERLENVKELLTTYQNAHCVVTSRLHCALPCMAMETPVAIITDKLNGIRLGQYKDMVYSTTTKQFLNHEFEYDFKNPPPNSDKYLALREKMIGDCKEFVERMSNYSGSDDELMKLPYSDEELYEWQSKVMHQVLRTYFIESLKKAKQITKLEKRVAYLEKENSDLKKPSIFMKKAVKKILKRK